MATKRIYLSPSNQEHNEGVCGYNEENAMHKLACKVGEYLTRSPMFLSKISDPGLTNKQVAEDSNEWGADFHLCLHSDADDGTGKAQGTTVFFLKHGGDGEKFAKLLYTKIAALSPGKDRGVSARPGLLELNSTDAPAALIENFFHTNVIETNHFYNNIDMYAKETAKAFYEFYEVPFIDIKNIAVGHKTIIQTKCKFDSPKAVWDLLDKHKSAESLYRKWANSYL